MCFGKREKDSSGMTRSRDIDRTIRQDEKRMAKEVKLLLLGMLHDAQHLLSRQRVTLTSTEVPNAV